MEQRPIPPIIECMGNMYAPTLRNPDVLQAIMSPKSTSTSAASPTALILLLCGTWNRRLCNEIGPLIGLSTNNKNATDNENYWFLHVKSIMNHILNQSNNGYSTTTTFHPSLIRCATTVADFNQESLDLCVNGLESPSELPALVILGIPNDKDLHNNDSSGVDAMENLRMEHVQFHPANLNNLFSKKPTNTNDGLPSFSSPGWQALVTAMNDAWFQLFDDQGNIIRPPQTPKLNPNSHHPINKHTNNNKSPATRIFIAGDRSQVGKSSICMGLLGSLLRSKKYAPDELAYIKPATQCEQTQLVEEYCKSKGITACRPVGPIVYYKGFTRSFLKGEVGQDSNGLLQLAAEAVDELSVGKRVVIVDGVGYPAVGSITGTDNASVAVSCGRTFTNANTTTTTTTTETIARAPIPVLLVGKSGVGDAVDSFNLNATYFTHRQVPVIGAIFNKLSLDGFYSLDNCKEAIDMYFDKYQQDKRAYGFIPEIPSLNNARETVADVQLSAEERSRHALEMADVFVQQFVKHVDVEAIVRDAEEATLKYVQQQSQMDLSQCGNEANDKSVGVKRHAEWTDSCSSIQTKFPRVVGSTAKHSNGIASTAKGFVLTREQIEAFASAAGAAGG